MISQQPSKLCPSSLWAAAYLAGFPADWQIGRFAGLMVILQVSGSFGPAQDARILVRVRGTKVWTKGSASLGSGKPGMASDSGGYRKPIKHGFADISGPFESRLCIEAVRW